jgi:hypothetical protein
MLQDSVDSLGKKYKVDTVDLQEFMALADLNHNKKLEKKEVYTIFRRVVKPA